MGIILLEGLEFFAYHGHYQEERVIGTKFIVDVEYEYPSDPAEVSDKIADALNYQEVFMVVKREMEITSHLLEHVARRILDAIHHAFPAAGKVRVKISKVNPQLGGKVKHVSCVLSY
jgi:7,8-dihydroneopterin aldolase/epimerase/oxygenase